MSSCSSCWWEEPPWKVLWMALNITLGNSPTSPSWWRQRWEVVSGPEAWHISVVIWAWHLQNNLFSYPAKCFFSSCPEFCIESWFLAFQLSQLYESFKSCSSYSQSAPSLPRWMAANSITLPLSNSPEAKFHPSKACWDGPWCGIKHCYCTVPSCFGCKNFKEKFRLCVAQ